jgi:hypothetical protein
MLDRLTTYISARILRYLAEPTKRYAPFFAPAPEVLRRALQPGDILLIEGNTRLSAIIKFLTQSTWSHAALCARRTFRLYARERISRLRRERNAKNR